MKALLTLLVARIAAADPDIGGELREWVEATRYVAFGHASDAEWMQRARIHVSDSFGGVRLYLEPISGIEYGRDLARASDKDAFDLHAAYVDVGFLRLGRQELAFGSGRVLDTRDGPNIRASYDGARAHTSGSGFSLDAFLAREVAIAPGVLDDRSTNAIWGTWATYASSRLLVDAYALGVHRDGHYQRVSGDELRHTLGMRVRISESGYAGEVETAIQRGQISSTPVDAWLLGGELVAKIVTIGGGITSGDPGQGALGTFSPLSFRAAYFGYLAANGASNEIGVHAALNQALPRHVSVRVEVWEFWRQSLSDGVYGLTGALLRPAGPHDGRFMGTQAEALATWKPDRHITIGATVSQFYASALLRNTITYGATWITFGF